MDSNEIKLPDLLTDLIMDEKREGIKKFESSDFEMKIYNRIGDQNRGHRVLSKWILAPVSLVLLLVSAIFMFKGDSENLPGGNKLQMVFETVINKSSRPRGISAELIEEREKIANLQIEIFSSVKNSEIDIADLSEHIKSSMISATGGYGPELKILDEMNMADLLRIKADIANMNNKDDYSELFSRIIIKLTEG